MARKFLNDIDLDNNELQNASGISGGGGGTATGARCRQSAPQSIPSATPTFITFDVEDFDTGSFHDNVTNNTRFTITETSVYFVHGSIGWATNATGYREATLVLNGSDLVEATRTNAISGTGSFVEISGILELTAGDYIEMRGVQNSGGNVDTIEVDGRTNFAIWDLGASASGGGGGDTLIDEQVLSNSTTNTITFSSIPQTYDSLRVELISRCTEAATGRQITLININGDSTNANYHQEVHFSLDGTDGGFKDTGTTDNVRTIGQSPRANSPSQKWGESEMVIKDYTDTTRYKIIGFTQNSAFDTSDSITTTGFIQWENTAAITSIDLVIPGSFFFENGTIARLYGQSEGGGSGGGGSSAARIYDLFTDTNGTLITAHTPDLDDTGNGYIDISSAGTALVPGSTDIQSNEVSINADGQGFGIDLGSTEGTISCEYTYVASDKWFRLHGRWIDNDNYIECQFRPSNSDFVLVQRVGGVGTSPTPISFTWVTGATYTVSLSITGGLATATVRRNDASTQTAVDTFQLTSLSALSGTTWGITRSANAGNAPTINIMSIAVQ